MLPKGAVNITDKNHIYIPGIWNAPGSACGLLEAGVVGAGFETGAGAAGVVWPGIAAGVEDAKAAGAAVGFGWLGATFGI